MTNVLPIARDALRTLWRDKRLWLFGFFVAAGASGGVQLELPAGGLTAVPPWVLGLLVGAAIAGLAMLALHAIGEGALIHAVRAERRGRRVPLAEGWRRGWSTAGRVLGIKLLVALGTTLALGSAAAPAVLGALERVPLAAGVALTVLLLLGAVPFALSLVLAHEVGLRLAVLEDRRAVDALRAGLRFLRGRLRFALILLVVDGLAQVAASLVALPFALLAVGLGFLGYLAAGLPVGIAVGAVLAAPVGVLVVAARGTFRSALWTHGVLDERPSAA